MQQGSDLRHVICCCFVRTTDSVPLGEPLMNTVIEVRDDEGHLVTEGEGQVFIGENSFSSLLILIFVSMFSYLSDLCFR